MKKKEMETKKEKEMKKKKKIRTKLPDINKDSDRHKLVQFPEQTLTQSVNTWTTDYISHPVSFPEKTSHCITL